MTGASPNAGTAMAAEDGIRHLVEEQVRAIRAKDADAVMALYAPQTVSFDVVAPLRSQGAGAVRERLEGWFAAYDGPIGVEIRDLDAAAAGDVGFCHGLQRITGTLVGGAGVNMWVRVTMGLRMIDGTWRIVHVHMSDPFDPQSGLALTELEP